MRHNTVEILLDTQGLIVLECHFCSKNILTLDLGWFSRAKAELSHFGDANIILFRSLA